MHAKFELPNSKNQGEEIFCVNTKRAKNRENLPAPGGRNFFGGNKGSMVNFDYIYEQGVYMSTFM